MKRRDAARTQQAQVSQQEAKNQSARANYDRAVKTCLEARNYSVN